MDSINSKGDLSFSTNPLPMLFLSDETQEVIKVNKAFEDQLFRSLKIVGRSLDEITQPILDDDFTYSDDKARDKKYVYLKVGVSPSEIVTLNFTKAILDDKPGSLVILRNLFPSKRSRKKDRDKSQNSSSALAFLIGEDAKINQVNDIASQKLGYTKEELLNMSMYDITHDPIHKYTNLKWNEFTFKKQAKGEHLLKTNDNDIIYAEYRAVANIRIGLHLWVFREIENLSSGNNFRLEMVPKATSTASDSKCIAIIETNLKIKYINDACLEIFDYKKKKNLLGRSLEELFPTSKNKLEELKYNLKQNKNWQGELTITPADGAEINLKLKNYSFPDDNTIKAEEVEEHHSALMDTTNYKHIGVDKTKSKDIDQALSFGEESFQYLLRTLPDGLLIVNQQGEIEFSNTRITEILGYTEAELIGQPVEKLIPESLRSKHTQHRKKYNENPHQRSMGTDLDLYAKHKDGSRVPVDIMLGPIENKGTQNVIAIIRDITRFKETESKLKDEKKFSQLLHSITSIANENDNLDEALGKSIRKICKYMGWPVGHVYLPADDGTGEFYPSDIWHLEEEEKFEAFKKMTLCTRFSPGVGMVGEVIESATPQWYMNANEDPGYVRRMPDMDLNIRACFGLPILVEDEVVGVLEFYSDRVFPTDSVLLKKMKTIGIQLGRAVEREKSQQSIRKNMKLFKELFDHSPAGVVILNKEEEVTHVNESFTKIFGYEPKELIGEKLDDRLTPPKLTPEANEITRETFEGATVSKESVRLHKDGHEIPVIIHTVPVPMDDEILAVYGIYVDLSKIKNTENELRKSLDEKKHLLEEIHHRVKNNLAIITSLLHLQINQVDNEVAVSKLKDSQARIHSMALVHEHLYQMESFSYLELDTYIRNLSEKIHSTFNDPEKDIQLTFNIDQVKVTLDQAITCGQLINEIMTNAFKHAFTVKEEGKIEITLTEDNGNLELEISDNGNGIPDEMIQKKRDSLGLNLIDTLTKQLEGEIDIRNDNGTTFSVCFPLEEPKNKPPPIK